MRRPRKNAAGGRSRISAIADSDVAALFRAYPPDLRARLMHLRRLIFETAAATEGVGTLEETLKWGQPSYLTTESKSGSTIRIDRVKSDRGEVALYFHCQSGLVPSFRALYPDEFSYGGDRSILFEAGETIDEAALRHCIALALTHHLRKRGSPATRPRRSPNRK